MGILKSVADSIRFRSRRRLNQLEKYLYRNRLLDPSTVPFPDFLGIGAQKAGTSWLYENLKSHPDLFLPEEKELHYFDWNYDRRVTWYSSHFRQAENRVKGEITPGYSIISTDRIHDVYVFNPDVKLIFLMRNPIDRAWSQARMNLVRFTNRSFGEVPRSEFYEHFQASRSVERGDYQKILSKWTSVFSEDQIYIDFFERISGDPRGLLSEVFRFLGVTTEVDWGKFPFNDVVFANPSRQMPDEFRHFLEDFYEEDIRELHEAYGGQATRWLNSLSGEAAEVHDD